MSKEDWGRSWKPWLRGTALGFPFGAIPAGGAEIPTFLSYLTERKLTKHPEEFGKGAIEGVAGPEAANNASAAGTMVPLLALGLPTNATAAIIIAAFMSYGIEPGPLLLTKQPDLVWMLIASLFIGNVFLLVLNLPLAPTWAKLLRIPRPYLYAGILFFASMGAYAVQRPAVRPLPPARARLPRVRDAAVRAARAAAHRRRHPRAVVREEHAPVAADQRRRPVGSGRRAGRVGLLRLHRGRPALAARREARAARARRRRRIRRRRRRRTPPVSRSPASPSGRGPS